MPIAAAMGDRAWRDVVERHRAIVRGFLGFLVVQVGDERASRFQVALRVAELRSVVGELRQAHDLGARDLGRHPFRRGQAFVLGLEDVRRSRGSCL